MTLATTPTRFDSDLFASAKTAGGRTHRSAAQQLAHWARLGQELEASAGLSHRDIERVLAGQISYDQVGEREQAAVRTTWREQVEEDVTSLDLRARFKSEGRTRWSEADGAGNVTVTESPAEPDGRPGRAPARPTRVAKKPAAKKAASARSRSRSE
jgi:hypothetical protein